MQNDFIPRQSPTHQQRLFYCFLLVYLCLALSFSIFFILSDRSYLINWFAGLSSCLFGKEDWASHYFTPATKAAGNWFCVFAIIISIAGFIYAYIRFRIAKPLGQKDKLFVISKLEKRWIVACCVVVAGFWFLGNSIISPAMDEVFSADQYASLHPLQTISYYISPNNHLFFNLINSVFTHLGCNGVISGRLLSLACYLLIAVIGFIILKRFTNNNAMAFMGAIIVAVQFPVWGFAVQARGYELLSLIQLVALSSLIVYTNNNSKDWLIINSVTCIVGYATLPSFMYYHFAQLVFMFLLIPFWKKEGFYFWVQQIIVIFMVFLFYLPAFCFSGMGAITNNRFVSALPGSYDNYLNGLLPILRSYVNYCFGDNYANLMGPIRPLLIVIFFLPLTLFWAKRSSVSFRLALFYVLMIGIFIGMILLMKRYPYHRTLTGHFTILLLLDVYAIYRLISYLFASKARIIAGWIVFPAMLIASLGVFIKQSKKNLSGSLYFYDVNGTYNTIDQGIKKIPAGQDIAVSENSFYWYYMGRNEGYRVNKCIIGNENYLIKSEDEPIPPFMRGSYKLYAKVDDYEILKREGK